MNGTCINKTLIVERFTKAIPTYAQEASVQQQIALKMVALLRRHNPFSSPRIIEFGCGTGVYSNLLATHLRPQTLWLNDLCPEMEKCCADLLSEQVHFLPGDAENRCWPEKVNIFTSCSALQWFESPKRFFRQCSDHLTPEGVLAFTTFGEKNMWQMRQLTQQGLVYQPLEQLVDWLSEEYTILEAKEEQISLPFQSGREVLQHLKQTGVTGLQTSDTPIWTPQRLRTFCTDYRALYPKPAEYVELTYHPIYLVAQKKSE